MSLMPDQGGGKKRTKLEKLLRQDHSDVYFDNDKLNDELNNKIDALSQEMYKQDIARTIEVHKLRREIQDLRDTNPPSAHDQLREIYERPQTTGNLNRRKTNAPTLRSKSAWAKVREEDTGSVHEYEEPDRPASSCSSVSTLQDTITLRKYYNIGGNSFKENNRFPEEWYIRCLPASDAALYEARKVVRGKSAPPQFTYLSQLRMKDVMKRNIRKLNRIKTKLIDNEVPDHDETDNANSGEKTTLVCDQPVKPIVMPLRRYKAMGLTENFENRAPSRSTQRKQTIKERNAFTTRLIDERVRTFCRELTQLKERELREEKEQEERRRTEAQEQLYLLSAAAASVKAAPISAGGDAVRGLHRGLSFRDMF